uniref:Phosphoprotein n=1 Tax=Feline morbillivirus TaxID=1170234 RepID=A0A4Y5S4Z9_9MONO|nr:P/V/C protein [Feline morbillivirus]QDA18230.1 P/V/C protein [Feline morbillivirus]QDA18236.1 P/V/C protein [Feline morbillivirus]QDA18242.1 P/V/C protein [Feline morbillivirus]QDA18248.1 P/V/C protein [Feline morbillivirus]
MSSHQIQQVKHGLESLQEIKNNPPSSQDVNLAREIYESIRQTGTLSVQGGAITGDSITSGSNNHSMHSQGPSPSVSSVNKNLEGPTGFDHPGLWDSEGNLCMLFESDDDENYYSEINGRSSTVERLDEQDNENPGIKQSGNQCTEGVSETDSSSSPQETTLSVGGSNIPRTGISTCASLDITVNELEDATVRNSDNMKGNWPIPKLLVKPPPRAKSSVDHSNPLKGATGGRLVLPGMETTLSEKSGVTPSVHLSTQPVNDFNVNVNNVRQPVLNVNNEHSDSKTTMSNLHSDIEDKSEISIQDIYNLILGFKDDYRKLSNKLDMVLEMKQDIDNLKKSSAKVQLALSTIEGHLSSVMIAIPGSGIDSTGDEKKDQMNPDLKPLLGRDHCRAFREVTNPLDETSLANSPTKHVAKINKNYTLQKINKNETSAIKFVPNDSHASVSTIRSIIRSSNLDQDLKTKLLTILSQIRGTDNIKEFYEKVMMLIKSKN